RRIRAGELGLGHLGEGHEGEGVTPAQVVEVTVTGQFLLAVLANGGQHYETWVLLDGRRATDKALVCQRRQAVENIRAQLGWRPADRFGLGQERAAGKDRKAVEKKSVGLL